MLPRGSAIVPRPKLQKVWTHTRQGPSIPSKLLSVPDSPTQPSPSHYTLLTPSRNERTTNWQRIPLRPINTTNSDFLGPFGPRGPFLFPFSRTFLPPWSRASQPSPQHQKLPPPSKLIPKTSPTILYGGRYLIRSFTRNLLYLTPRQSPRQSHPPCLAARASARAFTYPPCAWPTRRASELPSAVLRPRTLGLVIIASGKSLQLPFFSLPRAPVPSVALLRTGSAGDHLQFLRDQSWHIELLPSSCYSYCYSTR